VKKQYKMYNKNTVKLTKMQMDTHSEVISQYHCYICLLKRHRKDFL